MIRKKGVEEEEMNLESEVYKSIETYSPPNLKKYISTEVEQLLSSKVTVFNQSEYMTLIYQSQFVGRSYKLWQLDMGLTLPLYFYSFKSWAIGYTVFLHLLRFYYLFLQFDPSLLTINILVILYPDLIIQNKSLFDTYDLF